MNEEIKTIFYRLYNQEPKLCVSSPGRINLIGEHTDYNNGFVLPASIDKKIYAAFSERSDGYIYMYSIDFNENAKIRVEEICPSVAGKWTNYILGVVAQLIKNGYLLSGFNIVIGGDIPIGEGLSSSAAMECAVIYGLNELFNFGIGKLQMVKMAQLAEHEYAGVRCGIMDQFASMFGKKNKVIQLDCRSLEYSYKPFIMDGFKVLLFDTNIKHSLASSEYNIRRKQCETGVEMIQQHVPAVSSLRDANLMMLKEYVLPVDVTVYQRCRYVVEENNRLLEACIDLEKANIAAFGRKMYETHEGLSNLYEVSCSELDFLVSHVRDNERVLGARMMGGGFGGCTINLVKEDVIDEVILYVSKAYYAAYEKELSVHIVTIEDGTAVL